MSGYCARCGSMVCECDVPVKVMNERVAELEQENAELKQRIKELEAENVRILNTKTTRLVDIKVEAKRADKAERESAELKRWNANLKTENFKLSQEAATILEHCKDMERIIAESQKQEPVAWQMWDMVSEHMSMWQIKPKHLPMASPLYATPVIQEGMQIVPIEMTDAMRDAGNEIVLDRSKLNRIWEAMLNASKEG